MAKAYLEAESGTGQPRFCRRLFPPTVRLPFKSQRHWRESNQNCDADNRQSLIANWLGRKTDWLCLTVDRF